MTENVATQFLRRPRLKLLAAALAVWLLLAMPSALRAQTSQPLPRVVDLKTPDGTVLKGAYFTAAKQRTLKKLSTEQ